VVNLPCYFKTVVGDWVKCYKCSDKHGKYSIENKPFVRYAKELDSVFSIEYFPCLFNSYEEMFHVLRKWQWFQWQNI